MTPSHQKMVVGVAFLLGSRHNCFKTTHVLFFTQSFNFAHLPTKKAM